MQRKKLATYAFTALAALGLGMYLLLPRESELRFLGLIIVIFWLPMAVRNLTRLVKERAATLLQPKPITPGAFHPREVNAKLEATFSVIVGTDLMHMDGDGGIWDLRCLLVLGSDGFSARLWRADNVMGPWPSGETLLLNAEFLVPERALPRFPADTIAQVLLRNTVIGTVKVLGVSMQPSAD